jgi:hypothetical protein
MGNRKVTRRNIWGRQEEKNISETRLVIEMKYETG